MLPPEQTQQIKQQIIAQIEATFPPGKKQQAIQQVQAMNSQQLEDFLIQNKLIKSPESLEQISQEASEPQCVFCLIVEEKIPSYKIDENKDAIAVLEINPLSQAHTIIIPKKHISHIDKLPQSAFTLAKKISKKIKAKIKPDPIEIKIETAVFMEHAIISIIPIYKDIPLKKQKASEEHLEKLQKTLEKKSKSKIIKKSKPIELKEGIEIRLPRRIP